MKLKILSAVVSKSFRTEGEKELRFVDLLFLLFLGLKLSHHIDWSWWLIFCPLFVTVIIAFLVNLREQGIRNRMTKEQIAKNKENEESSPIAQATKIVDKMAEEYKKKTDEIK